MTDNYKAAIETCLYCEKCGEISRILDCFVVSNMTQGGDWRIECIKCEGWPYHIKIRELYGEPCSLFWWLNHLSHKMWFKPEKLNECLSRLNLAFLAHKDRLRQEGPDSPIAA